MGSLARTHGRDEQDTQGFSRVPMLVQWMATLRCPLSCPHCLAGDRDLSDMPLARVSALIDEVADLGVEEFLITGGEPLVREDLPAVLEHLARRHVSYSLNTACLPSDDLARAFRRWPPAFVAVSVDGPASCHDSFRGRAGAFRDALASIEFFAGLCQVAAGTTVTTANLALLEQTFHLVTRSGASAWGLHLPVAEGRARQRPELFPSKAQLKRLLAFTARKRRYFPVAMADELGYCGDVEPLVRDQPLRCGAGRSQCVVLPDGEVVPCTTLDPAAGAGNLNERSLFDIWTHGFPELRRWEPAGKCTACRYARACQGGCWLQRRHGTPCHRDVWHVPAALRSAAGVALCLGALATPGSATARPATPPERSPLDCGGDRGPCSSGGRGEVPAGVERWSYCYLADEIVTGTARMTAKPRDAADRRDPVEHFFTLLRTHRLAKDLPGRVEAVSAALATRERSLALIAVLWRTLAEPCLDGPPAAQRPPVLRGELRAALATLERSAAEWRREIFAKKLDPYLARDDRRERPYMACKAMPVTPAWLELARDTRTERWSRAKGEALDGFLARHPYPAGRDLRVAELTGGAKLLTAGGSARTGAMGIFDVMVTTAAAALLVLADPPDLRIALPAHAELTYADILRLADEQHGPALDKQAARYLATGRDRRLAHDGSPLLLQPMRRLARRPVRPTAADAAHAARWWLADFWMF